MPAALKELPKAPASYFGGKPKSYGGERYARRAEGYISLKECRTDKPPRHAAHDFLVELKDWSIVHLKAPNYFKVSQDEVIFRGLAHKWKRETGHFSVLARRYQHPSYRAILNMGQAAVPLILKDLRREPDRWFAALQQLTGKNPAKDATNFYEAVDRWIAWGISEGLIS